MTRTFDPKFYTDLLVRYQPKPILTEAENDAAIALAQNLEHRSQRSPEEEVFLDLLLTLIEKFEAEHYPIPESNGTSIVLHLMDARDLTEGDLIPILGTQAAITEILTHQRTIKPDEAKKLAAFFQVDSSLFLEANRLSQELL